MCCSTLNTLVCQTFRLDTSASLCKAGPHRSGVTSQRSGRNHAKLNEEGVALAPHPALPPCTSPAPAARNVMQKECASDKVLVHVITIPRVAAGDIRCLTHCWLECAAVEVYGCGRQMRREVRRCQGVTFIILRKSSRDRGL